jgi:hypothetical protein
MSGINGRRDVARPAAVLALALVLCSGCSALQSRVEKAKDNVSGWSDGLRTVRAPGSQWGVSDQARAVERNLGVR